MKSIQITNTTIQYQCEADDCTTPGQVHEVEKPDVMAALYTLLEELAMRDDLRTEALELAVEVLWERLYPQRNVDSTTVDDERFVKSFTDLKKKMHAVSVLRQVARLPRSKTVFN